MREETEYRPKPMVNIGGKPILWHIMKIYANYGFNEFVLCLGYKGWMIKEYFLNYRVMHNDFTIEIGKQEKIKFHNRQTEEDWKVTLAETRLNAMTGARIKRIEKYIDGDTFMLAYGDTLADVNIHQLLDFHETHGKLATVTGVCPPSRFGVLDIEQDHVKQFHEKPDVDGSIISAGFFVLDRRIFEYLSEDDICTFETEPLEQLAKIGQLMMYRHRGFYQCMDTYRDFVYLNDLWDKGSASWRIWEN